MQTEVLGERYQLQDSIGRGGMATIYRGVDTRMDRVVAMKVLREVYSTDPKFVTRFQREAKAASALQHPNIVQVYDYGQTDGNYFIVMELIEGTDLRRYLRSRGVLAVDRAMIIAHDVALGLGAAHRRNIVHRDVKPQNILVGRDGSIKLTDFGIASVYKDINDERLTTTGMTLGTVQYYAPEQAQGEVVSPAADVYALGIVMYEMLTGRTPFDGDTPVAIAMQHIQDTPVPPSQHNPNIPRGLEEIILRCLEKIPEMRFRDGDTLAQALESVTEGVGVSLPSTLTGQAVRTNLVSEPNHKIPRRPGSAGIGEGIGVAALAAESMVPTRNGTSGYNAGLYPAQASANAATAMTEVEHQPLSYNTPFTHADAPRSFNRGTGTPFGTAQNAHKTRTFSIITALILLATVCLLGFSIFIGIMVLGNHASTGPGSLSGSDQVDVPNLVGETYDAAKIHAQTAGFSLYPGVHPPNLDTNNSFVADQDRKPPEKAPRGTAIMVDLGPKIQGSLIGQPTGQVFSTLKSWGFTNIKEAQFTPNQPGPALALQGQDIVFNIDPKVDTVVAFDKLDQPITLYSAPAGSPSPPVNTPAAGATPTVGVTPGTTPTTGPTPMPTPLPTTGPTPMPTPTMPPKPH